MTTTLVALAVVMAVVIGWLVWQTIGARPWVPQRALAGELSGQGLPLPATKIGLGVFMAVATSLFALCISAYMMRREGTDWRPLAPPAILWANTLVLVLASVFFQRAAGAARSERDAGLRRELLLAGIFTLAFLAGQLWAWRELGAAGYYLTANPANAFFYLLTALHAAHLLGGLWVWGTSLARSLRGAAARELRLRVELCTAYWHFLLAIWAVLFGLLLLT